MTDLLEIVLDQKVVEPVIFREHLLEQLTQAGNIPLTIAELVDEAPFGRGRIDLKLGIEGLIGRLDAQIPSENQKRVTRRVDHLFGKLLLPLKLEPRPFPLCNVLNGEQDAI